MRRNNFFGKPIYKNFNIDCKYFHDNSRDKKFDICICPVAEIVMKKNNFIGIISCSDDFEKCEIYEKSNKNDESVIKKFIEKNSSDSWILISGDEWKSIKEKIEFSDSDFYLDSIFRFFGFYQVDDNRVKGILYSNNKIVL